MYGIQRGLPKSGDSFQAGGHTFKELKEMFKITPRTYYQWVEILETIGGVKVEIKQTRKRKIDPDALKKAVEEKPDAYLRELSEEFNRSTTAIYKRLISLGFTYKKTFTYSEKSEEVRAKFCEKPARIPEETRTRAV
ncbi:MAG: transposase [Synergistaceae bacterium]|jgi:transposase|nr:transposase [Synergistaceae bacterium]